MKNKIPYSQHMRVDLEQKKHHKIPHWSWFAIILIVILFFVITLVLNDPNGVF